MKNRILPNLAALVLGAIVSSEAMAKDCILGGRYERSEVEQAIAKEMHYEKVKITGSRYSVISPAMAVIDAIHGDAELWRSMSFDVTRDGQVLRTSGCTANFDLKWKTLTVMACASGTLEAQVAGQNIRVSLRDLPACE